MVLQRELLTFLVMLVGKDLFTQFVAVHQLRSIVRIIYICVKELKNLDTSIYLKELKNGGVLKSQFPSASELVFSKDILYSLLLMRSWQILREFYLGKYTHSVVLSILCTNLFNECLSDGSSVKESSHSEHQNSCFLPDTLPVHYDSQGAPSVIPSPFEALPDPRFPRVISSHFHSYLADYILSCTPHPLSGFDVAHDLHLSDSANISLNILGLFILGVEFSLAHPLHVNFVKGIDKTHLLEFMLSVDKSVYRKFRGLIYVL
jgi:hypothetical protein